MANWTKNFTQVENINSGYEFELTDVPTLQMVNAPINNTQYLYDELITNGNYKITSNSSESDGRLVFVRSADNYKKIYYTNIIVDADANSIQAEMLSAKTLLAYTDVLGTMQYKSVVPYYSHKTIFEHKTITSQSQDGYLKVVLYTTTKKDTPYTSLTDILTYTKNSIDNFFHIVGHARDSGNLKIVVVGNISSSFLLVFFNDGSSGTWNDTSLKITDELL